MDRYVRDSVHIASLNPFEIHIIFLDSVITSWRTYIMGLAEAMTQLSAVSLDLVVILISGKVRPRTYGLFRARRSSRAHQCRGT